VTKTSELRSQIIHAYQQDVIALVVFLCLWRYRCQRRWKCQSRHRRCCRPHAYCFQKIPSCVTEHTHFHFLLFLFFSSGAAFLIFYEAYTIISIDFSQTLTAEGLELLELVICFLVRPVCLPRPRPATLPGAFAILSTCWAAPPPGCVPLRHHRRDCKVRPGRYRRTRLV